MQKMQFAAHIFDICAICYGGLIMKNIAVFASGSGSNAENIIRYFAERTTARVVVVLSNKSDALVHKRAEMFGVPSFFYSGAVFREGISVLQKLSEYKVDFIVLAGFLPLVSSVIINAYENKIINIHPALLPEYGGKGMYGRYVHESVHAAKEVKTGITIHYINEKYDDGAVIFKAECPVLPEDTVDDIERKVHELEYKHYPVIIEGLLVEKI
jgi:Folate-dependent phosphoribosylglycinamide formyltransferase PurN